MSNIRGKVVNIIEIFVISVVVLCTLFLLKYAMFDNKISGPFMKRNGDTVQTVMLFGTAFFILALVLASFHIINHSKDIVIKYITIGLFVISALIYIVLIINTDIWPNKDSYVLLDMAKEFAKTEGQIKKDNVYYTYFGWFSNNYFLTIIFAQIYKVLHLCGFDNSFLPFIIVNGICLYFSNYLAWKIVKKNVGAKSATKLLVLLTLNPVLYCMMFWVYSATISIPILLGIIYCGLAIYREDSVKKIIFLAAVTGILASVSYYIRPTSLFPLIAIMGLSILAIVKKVVSLKKIVYAIIPLAVCLILSAKIIGVACDSRFSNVSSNAFPYTHWIMMSSHGSGTVSHKDQIYTASFESKEEKKKANIEQIKKNYGKLGIDGTLKFWYKKIGKTFADGESQCGSRLRTDMKMGETQQLISGRYSEVFSLYCDGFRIVTFLLIIANLIWAIIRKEMSPLLLISAVTYFGGILFYCLWEIKASYSVPFLLVMLILATPEKECSFFNDVLKTDKSKKIAFLVGSAVVAIAWIIGNVGVYKLIQKDSYTIKEYSLRSAECWESNVPMLSKNGSYLLQEVPFKRDIKNIILYGYINGETEEKPKYLLEILDANKKSLVKKELAKNDFAKKKLSISFDKKISINPDEKYYVRITQISGGDIKTHFRTSQGINFGSYYGSLEYDETESSRDLYIDAYSKTEGVFMSKTKFLLLFIGKTIILMGVWIGLILTMRKNNQK